MTHDNTLFRINHLVKTSSEPEREYWDAIRQMYLFESGMMLAWQLVLEQGTISGRLLTRQDVNAIGLIMAEKKKIVADIIQKVHAHAAR